MKRMSDGEKRKQTARVSVKGGWEVPIHISKTERYTVSKTAKRVCWSAQDLREERLQTWFFDHHGRNVFTKTPSSELFTSESKTSQLIALRRIIIQITTHILKNFRLLCHICYIKSNGFSLLHNRSWIARNVSFLTLTPYWIFVTLLPCHRTCIKKTCWSYIQLQRSPIAPYPTGLHLWLIKVSGSLCRVC